MNVFHISLTSTWPDGTNVWFLFETDKTMKEIVDAVNDGKLVHGFELRTKPHGNSRRVREVTGVKERAIRLDELKKIGVPRWELVKFVAEDATA